jgi:peptide deformylase
VLQQGVLFHDRMRPSVLEANRKHLVGLEDAFVAEHPGVPVKRIPAPKNAKGFGAMAKK